MGIRIITPVIFVTLLSVTNAFAAEGKVSISSPENGATVSQYDKIELSYEAVPGPNGDHLHLYLDGKRIDVIRPMKGKADVGLLGVGKHHVCLAVNTRGHVPVGSEACVDVTSK